MKILWHVEPEDVRKIKAFVQTQNENPFVQLRIKRNLRENKPVISKEEFWKAIVSCLINTQQRSGPDSIVTKFINSQPFPLGYSLCISQRDVRSFAQGVIQDFGGLRRSNRIADELATNLDLLERTLWKPIFEILDTLRSAHSVEDEKRASKFIHNHFKGFGPKQSRNLLQSLGLTLYEIPIDSRITKWLNDFGFPVKLSATALSDVNYYNFVSEGLQQLCAQCGVYPCVLDAAIFASFDGGGWTDDNVVW